MPSRERIAEFLSLPNVALVGASHDPRTFAAHVHQALLEAGFVVTPVNPTGGEILGAVVRPSVREVPDPLDWVLVMVNRQRALAVVDDCIARGVERVWLHRGFGDGAMSEEAALTLRAQGIAVVEGACPLMFVEPVGGLHRIHRWTARRHFAA